MLKHLFLFVSIFVGVAGQSILAKAEPNKQLLYQLPADQGTYVGIAVWGGEYIVEELFNGNIRNAWDQGIDQSDYLAHGWCIERVPDLPAGFVRFGLNEGSTRPTRAPADAGIRGQAMLCLSKNGWPDVKQFCTSHLEGEGCAIWSISKGCVVNSDWLGWKGNQIGRPLDANSDADMQIVCDF